MTPVSVLDRFIKLALYRTDTGVILAGSEHTFTIAAQFNVPSVVAELTPHVYPTPLPLVAGVSYGIIQVRPAASVSPSLASNDTMTGGEAIQQASSVAGDINDPFGQSGTSDIAQDYIMSVEC